MFYVYIIESEKNGQWYYGHSEDVENRLIEHNKGFTRSTKYKRPWKLIFKRGFETKGEAMKFEYKLKRLRNKTYILEAYSEYFD